MMYSDKKLSLSDDRRCGDKNQVAEAAIRSSDIF